MDQRREPWLLWVTGWANLKDNPRAEATPFTSRDAVKATNLLATLAERANIPTINRHRRGIRQ